MIKDSDVIKSVLSGQTDIFSELVERYENLVRMVCLGILKNIHHADDATQDTFITAYKNLGSLKNLDAFKSWLLKIAKKCSIEILKKQKHQISLEQIEDIPAHNRNGQLDQDNAQLLNAIMKLPASQRDLITMRYFDGHSVDDAARITCRPVGSVTSLLSRARKTLAKRLTSLRAE